ncbi:hypothetical protein G7Y89_g6051 [Cudoniella acicularis]|uniref:Heterokaryon incompatibility domain-containing protein n=1 Tax=Cudoniella acicularis TaxID=354080 RepID=A0A8H4RMP8_9HELO|nr:hypothetical protein G7Y89_g6051 [Cudoniella acicularis]
MRLLNTTTKELEEFDETTVPSYGILSHTWEKSSEVLFHEIGLPGVESKKGYAKITRTCELAASRGLEYIWVDTCCIDKRSSAELSEAVNSMFQYYLKSDICFAYLADLDQEVETQSGLSSCRWFTRGWTLQELIASPTIEFYDEKWNMRGTKASLEESLHRITGINKRVLRNSASITSISVARKMSWAASRQTTRSEDLAYCLLGIFDVNMPLLYGEGPKSFMRLQEEIIKTTHDLSIFAWKAPSPEAQEFRGILARSPAEFASPPEQTDQNGNDASSADLLGILHGEFSVTNKGVKIALRLLCTDTYPGVYILPLADDRSVPWTSRSQTGIYIQKIGADTFVRARPSSIYFSSIGLDCEMEKRAIYVVRDLAANMCSSVHNIRRSAIQFNVRGCVRIRQIYPESLWDYHNKLLLVPDPNRFLGEVFLRKEEMLGTSTAPTISILFFFDGEKPIGYIQDNPSSDENGRFF